MEKLKLDQFKVLPVEAYKTILYILILSVFLYFERATGYRAFALVGISISIILCSLLIKKYTYTLYIEGLLIFVLLFFSRFSFTMLVILMLALNALHLGWQYNVKEDLFGIAMISGGLVFYTSTLWGYGVNYELAVKIGFIFAVLWLLNVLAYMVRESIRQRKSLSALNETLNERNMTLNATYKDLLMTNEALEVSRIEVIKLTEKAERAKIARELHDALGHEMTGLIMELEMIRRTKDEEKISLEIQALAHARDVLSQMRNLVVGMDEALELPLVRRILERLDKYTNQTGITVKHLIDFEENLLSDGMKEAVYKSFLEALTNIAKHSSAQNVELTLMIENGVFRMSIADDGSAPKGFVMGKGLTFIKERLAFYSGTLSITSGEQGTILMITIPLKGSRGEN